MTKKSISWDLFFNIIFLVNALNPIMTINPIDRTLYSGKLGIIIQLKTVPDFKLIDSYHEYTVNIYMHINIYADTHIPPS